MNKNSFFWLQTGGEKCVTVAQKSCGTSFGPLHLGPLHLYSLVELLLDRAIVDLSDCLFIARKQCAHVPAGRVHTPSGKNLVFQEKTNISIFPPFFHTERCDHSPVVSVTNLWNFDEIFRRNLTEVMCTSTCL